MKKRLVLVLSLVLVIFISSSVVEGYWTSDFSRFGKFLDTNVAEDHESEVLNLLPDGNGGAIAFWEEIDTTGHTIMAQKIDSNGNFLWGNGIEIDSKTNGFYGIAINDDEGGNSFVTWIIHDRELRNGFYVDIRRVMAQKVDGGGNLIWGEGINIFTYDKELGAFTEYYPILNNPINDDNGGAYFTLAIHTDRYHNSNDVRHIYASRIDSTGNIIFNEEIFEASNERKYGYANYGSVKSDGNSLLIIYPGNPLAGSAINAIKYDLNGNRIFKKGVFNFDISDVSGDIIRNYLSDNNNGIYVKAGKGVASDDYIIRFDENGNKIWDKQNIDILDGGSTLGAGVFFSDEYGNLYYSQAYLGENSPYYEHTELKINKVNGNNGNKIWDNDEGVLLIKKEGSKPIDIISDNNGGAYLTSAMGVEGAKVIRLQHVDNNGNKIWDKYGYGPIPLHQDKIITFNKLLGIISNMNNEIMIMWKDSEYNTVKIQKATEENLDPKPLDCNELGMCEKNGACYDDGKLVGNEVCEKELWHSCTSSNGGEVKGYYYCDESQSEWKPTSECFARNDYVDSNGLCEINYCGMEIDGPETIYTGSNKISDISLSGDLVTFVENNEIYYCNVNNCAGSKVRLTSNSYTESKPLIYGNYVVWTRTTGNGLRSVICEINNCYDTEKVINPDLDTPENYFPKLKGEYLYRKQMTSLSTSKLAWCSLDFLDECDNNFAYINYGSEKEGYYVYEENIFSASGSFYGYYNLLDGIFYDGYKIGDPRIFVNGGAPYGLWGAGDEGTDGYGKKIVYESLETGGPYITRIGFCNLENFGDCNNNELIELIGSNLNDQPDPKIYGNELLFKTYDGKFRFQICDLIDCENTNFSLYEKENNYGFSLGGQDIDGNIIVISIDKEIYKFEINKINSIDSICDEVAIGEQGGCGLDNICSNLCQCELPPGCVLDEAYWAQDPTGNIPYVDGAEVNNRTLVYLIQKGTDCYESDPLDIELWKKHPSAGEDLNFMNMESNFVPDDISSNSWRATWTFEGDTLPESELSSYYFKTKFYYGGQEKQSGILNVNKVSVAVCGDGIIEEDLGEVCDYSLYPEDGCGIGEICSNLCSCVPKPPCRLINAYWAHDTNGIYEYENNFEVNNNTPLYLIQKGLYCDEGDDIDFTVWEKDPIYHDELFTLSTSFTNDLASKSWRATWTYSENEWGVHDDDDDLGSDPREYYFITNVASTLESNKSGIIQVNNIDIADCGNGIWDEYYGEVCDESDDNDNGCTTEYPMCDSLCDRCYNNLGDNLTAFRVPNPCIDDGDGDEFGDRLVFYFIRNMTIMDPLEQGYIIRNWQQEEECVVPVGLRIPFFTFRTFIIVLLILFGYYLWKEGKIFKKKKRRK